MTSTTPDINERRSVDSVAVIRRAPPGRDGHRPDPDRWKALAVVLAAGFMTLLDVSIVNVALPSIEQACTRSRTSCSGSSRATRSRWGCCSCRRALRRRARPAAGVHGRRGAVRGRERGLRAGADALAARVDAARPGVAGGLISPQISGSSRACSGRGARQGVRLFGSTIAVSTAIGPLSAAR
jgi:hypothetical protein